MLSPLAPNLWSREHAAHLLNRAGFGGSVEEVDALYGRGPEGAVDFLLAGARGEPAEAERPAYAYPRNLVEERQARNALDEEGRQRERKARQKRDQGEYLQLVGDWVRQMRTGPAPLREKLALFWHGHFATSQNKVRPVFYLWTQKETFRRLALADIPAMVKAMLCDPAMLVWLDGDGSRASKPNENFAREVMELFTLGEGNYTEGDVAEAARAFTGYRINPADQSFRFAPLQHDGGMKTVLGARGRWTGEEVIDRLCAQPACARFMAWKLLRFFASDEPSPRWQVEVAAALRESGMALGPVLRRLFLSRAFYEQRRQQIKAPVEWLVQCLKVLDIPQPPHNRIQNILQQLGQMLYRPPNVKGWDGGKTWITTSTLFARYNIAGQLVNGEGGRGKQRGRPRDPGLLGTLPEAARSSEVDLVQYFALALFQEPCSGDALGVWCDFLKEKPMGSPRVQHQLLHLMMSTPEFQLV